MTARRAMQRPDRAALPGAVPERLMPASGGSRGSEIWGMAPGEGRDCMAAVCSEMVGEVTRPAAIHRKPMHPAMKAKRLAKQPSKAIGEGSLFQMSKCSKEG